MLQGRGIALRWDALHPQKNLKIFFNRVQKTRGVSTEKLIGMHIEEEKFRKYFYADVLKRMEAE